MFSEILTHVVGKTEESLGTVKQALRKRLLPLPLVGPAIERLESRPGVDPEDPFAGVERQEERLWLLVLVVLLLLSLSVVLIIATDSSRSAVPQVVAPLTSLLEKNATAYFLLVVVVLVMAYIREKFAERWRENRRLVGELTGKERALKKKDAQLSTWGELSHALIANFDLPRLLDLIVSTSIEVSGADRASVMLLDELEGVLTIKASRGMDSEVVASTRLALGEGIAGRVALTGQPLLLKRQAVDRQLRPLRAREAEISSSISVPLRIEERVVGTLNVSESKRPVEFREDDLHALTLFANQAALALEKAQLYRDSQKQLEKLLTVFDELNRTQAQLVHSEKLASLGVLAGGVAHEINNPLMVILGRTELLLMDDNLTDRVRRNLETVRLETERIAQIVQGLLAFARKSRQDKIEPVNINEVLERTIMLNEHQLVVGNVRIVKALQPDVPVIQANPGQLQQVFMNLLINAHHAMPEGGQLVIRTGTVPGGRVFIELEDSGVGIPPEDLGRIFDPFFTTKEEGKGTGLGLSVSRNIVQNHGGVIGVQSTLGIGTIFRIVLLEEPPPVSDPKAAVQAATAAAILGTRSISVS